ncbi:MULTISPECIES: hypothetical protein [Desulfosediminicola]|uniref:hypothetical protein n=1 Tax=Desulfosediminicola TaxID=2886823 RepID=UPI0012947E5A|nr:hypothetical protein [Desulfosediminicola ganghwensis]
MKSLVGTGFKSYVHDDVAVLLQGVAILGQMIDSNGSLPKKEDFNEEQPRQVQH